jgi:hypothetical protein
MKMLCRTLLAALALLPYLSEPSTAGTAQSNTDEGLVSSLEQYLEDNGYDLSHTFVRPEYDTQKPLGWINRVNGNSVISLNLGRFQALVDLINFVYGTNYTLRDPTVFGAMLYVLIHECAHAACCHGASGANDGPYKQQKDDCDEVLADINGANAACQFVADLLASLPPGQPPSPFMSELLHILCKEIDDERARYNNAFGRSAVANCIALAGNPDAQYSPCACTEGENPCAACPGFPTPGGTPENPDDVIPACDSCEHI